MLGSSGVGKSTLVNTLAGEELLATQPIREDDGEGRHTTTHRQLVLLPGGGLVLDSPGMRELQLWESSDGLSETFGDVEDLAAQCRFSDCARGPSPAVPCRQRSLTGPSPPSAGRAKQAATGAGAPRTAADKRLQAEAKKRWVKAGAEGRANMRAKGRR